MDGDGGGVADEREVVEDDARGDDDGLVDVYGRREDGPTCANWISCVEGGKP